MKKPKLLLVSPIFHSYWRSIQDGFTAIGYDTTTHCYDAGPRLEKLLNKFRYELPGLITGKKQHLSPEVVTQRAIAAVRQIKPDLVLVIRGDDLLPDFWEAVDAQGARRFLWLWDEIRRMKHDVSWLHTMSPLATYSKHDAAQLNAAGVETVHVLNAYDPNRKLSAPNPLSEISFVGARFERRETSLRALQDAGLPVMAYGRDWSDHLIDRARTFRLRSCGIPAHRDVSLEQAWAIMRDSIATINIHGDQDGFTMRTFEAPGVGAVQLIDRPDVADLFEPEKEVLVFSSVEELVDQARRAIAEPQRMEKIREAGAKRALAEHTFVHRAQTLEQLWA